MSVMWLDTLLHHKIRGCGAYVQYSGRLITKCILLQWIIFLTGHLRDENRPPKKSLEIRILPCSCSFPCMIILRNALLCKQHLACTTYLGYTTSQVTTTLDLQASCTVFLYCKNFDVFFDVFDLHMYWLYYHLIWFPWHFRIYVDLPTYVHTTHEG